MPVLDQWDIQITTDDVLRAQGADPAALRSRRPGLVNQTEEAIKLSKSILHPLVLFEQYRLKGLTHQRLEIDLDSPSSRKTYLSGPLISQHLGSAKSIIVMLCSIGNELDETVSSLFNVDPLRALALDGVGSAAVECLAIQACNYFEALAKEDGLKTSIPLNPGMVGWPVDQGQPEIFVLLDSTQIQVSLTESCMMVPNKSLSMVLGIGKDVNAVGSSCDYCSLKGVCKYQNHYAR